jgi:anaerobic selenocysteine-containing dehydrogenase
VFGTRTLHPLPDIDHSDFILIIGENPAVSHMSFVSIPHPMKHLKDAQERGATVLYINPREIESANTTGRVLKIRPDTDVYLLAALIHEIDLKTGFDEAAVLHGSRVDELRAFAAAYPAERVASITGMSAQVIRQLAHDFAEAPSACVHMSTGVNMGRQGTLAYWLVHMLSLVTGNLGRRGGNFYSLGFYERAPAAGRIASEEFVATPFGTIRKPGGGISLPGNLMADYLTDPHDPVKALFVSCGNPVLSIGGEQHMREALESLELVVSIDIYRNATAEFAHYVLPAAGAFEREDINITGLGLQFEPSVQYTDAVVPPKYERKPDWWIWERLAQRMGYRSAFDDAAEPNMWSRVDAMLRSRGHSFADLKAEQIIALERSRPEELFERVQHEDQMIDCCPPIFAGGIERMARIFDELAAEPPGQLKLISKRDGYMLNSWYSNVAKLKHRDRADNHLFMHPDDARDRQLAEADRVRVASRHGSLETTVKLSDDLMHGVVAMTHGGGHGRTPGMRIAHERPGVNCNALLPSGPDSYEPLSSQAHMTGVAVEVTKLAG